MGIDDLKVWRNGGDGCIAWAEENVRVPIKDAKGIPVWTYLKDLPDTPNPETGRSYKGMWEMQKQVLREALVMKDGKFVHMLIVLCWPRGEGKSWLVVIIMMWKFFCFPNQMIILCANSKEQSSFVHYDQFVKHIQNSPKLLRIIGRKNIQENLIRLRDSQGHIVSTIESVSGFSGIFSNITGYTFSEMFELKKISFFEKVDTSIRNIPNAFGLIDSTVSSKEHKLYELYKIFQEKKDPTIYFNYRYSKHGDYRDYWHPENHKRQLNAYRVRYALTFARFFLNLWSAGAERVFSAEQVEAIFQLGANGIANCHERVVELLRKRSEIIDSDKKLVEKGVEVYDQNKEIALIDENLWPVKSVYTLEHRGAPALAPVEALEELSDIYDTDWAIIGGIDRGQPMKRRTNARTIFVAMAKGLPGSRSNPDIGRLDDVDVDEDMDPHRVVGPGYIYIMLHVANVIDHSLEGLKAEVRLVYDEYDGIDRMGSESWGVGDLVMWCKDELDIEFETWQPTYTKQMAAFTELYTIVDTGRLKSPETVLAGSKGELISEEFSNFDHDPEKRWFGSPEKSLKHGVQDDFMYGCAWGIYGGRLLTVDDFRPRYGEAFWGSVVKATGLLGDYS